MADGIWHQIKGNWRQFTGEVKQRWADLTDDDITYIEGDRDKFVGRVQERYGILKEDAERQIDEWERSLDRSV